VRLSSWRLIDDELKRLIAEFQPFDPDCASLEETRARRAALVAPLSFDRCAVEVSEVWIERGQTDGPLRALMYRPHDATGTLPAFLHIHGGGYVLGKADYSDQRNEQIALAANCLVLSVDYRLAPETRCPGAVEDCLLGLHWLAANSNRLGIDVKRIAIGGESAGGGLAAATALLARDRGAPRPILQWLMYPMLDDRTGSTADPHPFAGEYIWNAKANRFGWEALLGCAPGREEVSPYAAAARATDLSGLPPAYIAVGALDLFVEENIEYARRLMRAGVPVELHTYPGAYHGFDLIGASAIGARCIDDATEALCRALHPR